MGTFAADCRGLPQKIRPGLFLSFYRTSCMVPTPLCSRLAVFCTFVRRLRTWRPIFADEALIITGNTSFPLQNVHFPALYWGPRYPWGPLPRIAADCRKKSVQACFCRFTVLRAWYRRHSAAVWPYFVLLCAGCVLGGPFLRNEALIITGNARFCRYFAWVRSL